MMSDRKVRWSAIAGVVGLLTAAGCGPRADRAVQPTRQVVVWRPLGSWAGHGNKQTESFTSETGVLRVHWETSHQVPGATGAFRLTAHSAISGRPLEQVVDHQGVGSGVGYVNQDPHVFYVVIEANGLDWQIAVEEGIAANVTNGPRR